MPVLLLMQVFGKVIRFFFPHAISCSLNIKPQCPSTGADGQQLCQNIDRVSDNWVSCLQLGENRIHDLEQISEIKSSMCIFDLNLAKTDVNHLNSDIDGN